MAKQTQEHARFHRFGDLVAFDFTDTKTLYVTSDMARELSYWFARFADDVDNVKFTDSTLSTQEIGE